METQLITFAEIEAGNLCVRAGVVPMSTSRNATKEGADYVLALAERIKNERMAMLMQQGKE